MATRLGAPLLHSSLLPPVVAVCCAVIGYTLLVLARPSHVCPWCWGKRVSKVKGRIGKCKHCRMLGRQVWPGATVVHRLFWRLVGDAWLARRKGGRS